MSEVPVGAHHTELSPIARGDCGKALVERTPELFSQTAGRENVEIRWQRTPAGATCTATWTP